MAQKLPRSQGTLNLSSAHMLMALKISIEDLFFKPVQNRRQIAVLVLVAFLLIFLPQPMSNDWDLNTRGFWSDIPNTYADPNRVYPPWGLILMIPYYLMRAQGARFFSALVIGLLVVHRGWSLSKFLAIALSPFTLWTLATSNVDILVLVFPILLWEMAFRRRWQSIGRGLALCISLLKPQAMIFIWVYWFWSCRKQWQELVIPVALAAVVTIPISLVGSPPLVIQWLNNVANPSPANSRWWTINNISLAAPYSLAGAILILIPFALFLVIMVRMRKMIWTRDHTLASLLITSMFLSPYASQQSVSSAFAFIPSWIAILIQLFGLVLPTNSLQYLQHIPLYVLLFAFASLMVFIPRAGDEKERAL